VAKKKKKTSRYKALPRITVIRDDREKDGHGWLWGDEPKKPGRCKILGTTIQRMKTGDYTLQGLEDKFVIERKAGFHELLGNIGTKLLRERFTRELVRMAEIPHAFLIVETHIHNDLVRLGITHQLNGPPSSAALGFLLEAACDYGVQVIFAGDQGKYVAQKLFETMARRYLR